MQKNFLNVGVLTEFCVVVIGQNLFEYLKSANRYDGVFYSVTGKASVGGVMKNNLYHKRTIKNDSFLV